MANGKNAGRLFPDCSGRYGYGESHKVVRVDGRRLRPRRHKKCLVRCVHCHKQFMLIKGQLIPLTIYGSSGHGP